MNHPEKPPGDHRIRFAVYDPETHRIEFTYECSKPALAIQLKEADPAPTEEALDGYKDCWVIEHGIYPHIMLEILSK